MFAELSVTQMTCLEMRNTMTELTEEKIEEYVNDIVDWKKDRDKSWEEIERTLQRLNDELGELWDEDKNCFKYYAPILVQKAKDRIFNESTFKGISAKHENWFWINNLKRVYQWNAFKEIMSGWSKTRFETVQNQSCDIVNFLANPAKNETPAEECRKKGLVYGNVQSGKTAHIAALIAMYASSKCDMIIVLSGVTKSLRLQTQNRLRHDLGIDSKGCYDLITAETDLIGKSAQNLEGRLNGQKPCIGVFKKSPAALKRLIKYCKKVNDEKSFWKNKTVLIIDDECDQYSINVKNMHLDDEDREDYKNGDFSRSTINGLIVDLLHIFNKYNYVGFTATPFANVLNEPPGNDSLYPKDFIYSLEMNKKYYGAKKIFGSVLEDAENPSRTVDSINYIDEEEINPKENSFESLPESLQNAINYFIVGTACKFYRGLTSHSSMLVHLDLKIAVHSQLETIINSYRNYVLANYKSIENKFIKIWNDEKDRIPFEDIKELFGYEEKNRENYKLPEYDLEFKRCINEVLSKLTVVVDNSSRPMEERLHYDDENPSVVIVIGGNTLSRGLTLEGLLVSCFYRTSKNYDTLLQMGRWFGYRIGYEDLARLYTTQEIAFRFSMLSDVEDELRDEFSVYQFDVTPETLSPKIRRHPSLQITRKMAMQAAKSSGINLCGYRPQTLFFPRNDFNFLNNNLRITSLFISSLGKYEESNGAIIFRNKQRTQIQDFIRSFNIDDRNKACNKKVLLNFFSKLSEREFLNKWNVAVLNKKSGKKLQISDSLEVGMVERSRVDLHSTIDDEVSFKTLSQLNNMLIDTPLCTTVKDITSVTEKFEKRHAYFVEELKQEEPGLLVIYPIDKDSKPVAHATGRLPLQSVENIIGFMLVFPNAKNNELEEYLSIPLEEIGEILDD